jgi:hypothetical protein
MKCALPTLPVLRRLADSAVLPMSQPVPGGGVRGGGGADESERMSASQLRERNRP